MTTTSSLSILFQNRPHIDTQPGGDSVVMKQLQKELIALGHKVEINADPTCDLSSYDIVHAFNLTLAQLSDSFMQNALRQNVPFVITSLQEDFPLYQHKAMGTIMIIQKYIELGQPREVFDKFMDVLDRENAANIHEAQKNVVTARFAAEHADRIFPCGETEAAYIGRLHPAAQKSLRVIHFGSTIKEKDVGPELFEKEFGVKNFVLCVARLELRKNQLMLLKALEADDIPVVFGDGGFTYHQAYTDACKKFVRKGKIIFTGRLSDELLISAYKAAAVHALPSWYELPGLVTLEAARYGCKVVASSWGAISDYMARDCVYCEPDNQASIRRAVFAAINTPKTTQACDTASRFTWKRSAENTLAQYIEVIGSRSRNRGAAKVETFPDIAVFMETVVEHVEKSEHTEAIKYFEKFRPMYGAFSGLEQFDALIEQIKKSNPPTF